MMEHIYKRAKKAEREVRKIKYEIPKILLNFWKKQNPERPCGEVSAKSINLFKN